MNDTLITIVAIFIAAVLMFVFPLMTIADRNDNIAKDAVKEKTVEFVNKEINIGAITSADLTSYKETINSLGHVFDVSLEVQKMDDNVGKKTTFTTGDVKGENVYYSVYTNTIENEIGSKGKYVLKEGDIFSCRAENKDTTIAQSLRNAFYSVTGKGTYTISGDYAGMVQNNGSSVTVK